MMKPPRRLSLAPKVARLDDFSLLTHVALVA
jgi:hypothetical protein